MSKPHDAGTLGRVVVLGAGAIGGSIGGLLFEAGHPVLLVARGEHGAAIGRDGLSVRLPDRALRVRPPCIGGLAELSPHADDIVILATKLGDAEPVLEQLHTVVGPEATVVCATNGVAAERWAMARFERVASMVVWMPATHLRPGEVRLHAAPVRGALLVGEVGSKSDPRVEVLCAWLRGVGFDAELRDDIDAWKHAKWIANLGGAAQALITDDWHAVAEAARAEGEAVLAAAGLPRISPDLLLERMRAVQSLPVDGEERPGGSTWQSRARGRPLESPFIEGAMAELAQRLGVDAPINARLARAAITGLPLTAGEIL